MNNHMPRTPLSTHLSRSARETEIRIRNIFSGPKKRPPVPLMILVAALCIFCGNIVSCQMAEPEPADISEPAGSSQGDRSDADRDERLNELLLDYLRAEYGTPAYLDTPEQPQERDIRLDSAALLGETDLDGTRLGLYQVLRSEYGQRMGELEWQQYSPFHLVFRMDEDGSPAEVLALAHHYTEDMSTEDAIRQAVWGLDDLEVCLYRDGFSTPIGPLMSINSSFFAPLIQNSETLYGYEPTYREGDYWFSADGDGFSSTNYYDPIDGTDSVFLLDVTRTDVSTPRGIRVGDSREAVLAAYPGIYDTPYLDYDGDYLWYCEYEEGWGSAVLFFFSNTDTVQSIQLHFLNY